MHISSIIVGIKKYIAALNSLSKETGISKLYLYIDCFWSWLRYGCVLNQYQEGKFYLRKRFERRNITTYRRWEKILKSNNEEYAHLLGNKLDFCNCFKDYIGREFMSSTEMEYDEFQSFLKRFGRVFVKPVDGLEGKGVFTVHFGNEEQNKGRFNELSSGNFIIEEPVIQHPDMVFGNQSVNTVRVYTVFDKKINKGVCLAATLRAGVGNSLIDNSHAGGVAYEVDLDTGIIDSKGWGHNHSDVIIHPGTDICMLGRIIPYWDRVIRLCQEASFLVPDIAFIGWDVAITVNGPILIEGNHDPDIDVLEFVGKYGYYKTIMNHLS